MSAVNVFSVNVPTAGAAPAPPAIADAPTPALPSLSIVPSKGSEAWTSGVAACFVGAPCFHVSLFYGIIFSHTAMGMQPKKAAAPKYWALYIPGDGYGIFSCWGLCSSNGATGGRWAAHKKFKGIDAWDQAMAFVAMHVTDAPVQHIDVWYSFVNGPRSASSTLHGQAGQLNLVHGPPSERPAGGVPVLPSERWEPLRVPSPGQQHVCSMRAPHISPTSRGGEQALPDALAMGSKSGARPSSNDSPDASSPELPGGIRTGRPRSQPPCLCGFVHCDMAGQHCPLTASHASVVVWPRLDGWSGLEQRPRRTSGRHHLPLAYGHPAAAEQLAEEARARAVAAELSTAHERDREASLQQQKRDLDQATRRENEHRLETQRQELHQRNLEIDLLRRQIEEQSKVADEQAGGSASPSRMRRAPSCPLGPPQASAIALRRRQQRTRPATTAH